MRCEGVCGGKKEKEETEWRRVRKRELDGRLEALGGRQRSSGLYGNGWWDAIG